MIPLYEIQIGLGHQENSIKVFSDRVVIMKPDLGSIRSTSQSLKLLFKTILQIFGFKFEGILKSLNLDYIGIDAKFSEIESVDLKLASNNLFYTGMITVNLKGVEKKKVTLFNYNNANNAIRFKAKHNQTAQQIKNYIDNMIKKSEK